jgi:NADH-quinone oxidoreductase subunit E
MSVRRLAAEEIQPPVFAFSPQNEAWAAATIAKYPPGRQQSAVILLLMRAQDQEGWVSRPAIEAVARMLDMAYIRVLEVATFYTQFQLKPVGTRAHVQVCGTTPCMLRGSEALMDVCRAKIHPEQFHTNAAGTLSWEEVECLGACVNAPMVMIFKDTFEDLTPERLGEIIDLFEAGKGANVPTGPQVDRVVSAPASGLTTLRDEKPLLKAVRDQEEHARAREATAGLPKSDGQNAASIPPTRAAKPKTFSMDTNAAMKSPSPKKAPLAGEQAASPSPPSHDPVEADRVEPAAEGEQKQRRHPTAAIEPASAHKSPEKLRGAPIGPAGKRQRGEKAAPPAEPTPESKTTDAPGAGPDKPGWAKKDGGR